jgi:hypothetical protein
MSSVKQQRQMRLALERSPVWDRLPPDTRRRCVKILSQLLNTTVQSEQLLTEENHEREADAESS